MLLIRVFATLNEGISYQVMTDMNYDTIMGLSLVSISKQNAN